MIIYRRKIGSLNDSTGLTGWLGYDGTRDGAQTNVGAVNWSAISGRTIGICGLTETLLACCYDFTTGLKVTAATVAAGVPTVGTPFDATTTAVTYASIARVSNSKFIAAWTTSGGVHVRTFTISGTTVSADVSTVDVTTASAGQCVSVIALSTTRAVVVHARSGGTTRAIGLTIGSGTLTLDGADEQISASVMSDIGVGKLSSTRALCGYNAGSTTTSAVVLTDTGTDLNIGSAVNITTAAAGAGKINCACASSTEALVTIPGSGSRAYAALCTIATTTITAPTAADDMPFEAGASVYMQTIGSESLYLHAGYSQQKTEAAVIVTSGAGVAGEVRVRGSVHNISSVTLTAWAIGSLSDTAAAIFMGQNASNVPKIRILQA